MFISYLKNAMSKKEKIEHVLEILELHEYIEMLEAEIEKLKNGKIYSDILYSNFIIKSGGIGNNMGSKCSFVTGIIVKSLLKFIINIFKKNKKN